MYRCICAEPSLGRRVVDGAVVGQWQLWFSCGSHDEEFLLADRDALFAGDVEFQSWHLGAAAHARSQLVAIDEGHDQIAQTWFEGLFGSFGGSDHQGLIGEIETIPLLALGPGVELGLRR